MSDYVNFPTVGPHLSRPGFMKLPVQFVEVTSILPRDDGSPGVHSLGVSTSSGVDYFNSASCRAGCPFVVELLEVPRPLPVRMSSPYSYVLLSASMFYSSDKSFLGLT